MSVDEVLVCDCGFEARATDEEALVEQVRLHASEAHGMALSLDEALAIARESSARTKEEA